ncbi:MAG: fused MFS/spermidine synthase [Bacteroidales bacterium]
MAKNHTQLISPSTAGIILFLVLFLSGASSLIYQIIWIRKFGLVFGVHVFSMAAVLTAFMGGLALGALYFGKLVDRVKKRIKLFLILEMGIALFAILLPFTFKGLEILYREIAYLLNPGQYFLQIIRFFLAFLFLLFPVTLMGGTMPVIIRIFVDNLGDLGNKVSRLYAVNNLGAVAGGFLAGFIIIQKLGLDESGYLGASINLLNTLLVLFVISSKVSIMKGTGNREADATVVSVHNRKEILNPFVLKLILWVFAIEGFTTLAYEIIWSRILVDFSMDKTVYFSSVIIITFVFGLSLGSIMVSRILDRSRNLLALLAANQILIGILSLFLLLVFTWLAPVIYEHRSMFGTWIREAGREYLFFFLILLPPVTIMGITYPLVSKLVNDNIDKLGNRMGFLGFLDTIGSVLGSFIAGFIMIPFLGVVKSFVIIVLINLFLGLVLFTFHPAFRSGVKSLIVFSTLLIAGTLFTIMPKSPNTRTWWDNPGKRQWFDVNNYIGIRFFDEGAAGTVTVREYPDGLALNINGHNTAYATPKDLKVNRQLGYLPYILHPAPKRALVIGYGMGATVCSLVQDDMESVDVAEICSGVIRASGIFSKWNRDAIKHPKVKVYDDDGRSVVFKATEKYDIITSNAIHPRLSNNIYTRDFYKLCRQKLNDNGILCQWVPENWMTETEYKSLVKAFIDAFPHTTMWYINEYSTLLIGTKDSLKVNVETVVKKFYENETLRKDYAEFDIHTPYHLLGQYWMDDNDLKKYTEGSMANTDNLPKVEFSKVINIAPVPEVMEFLIEHKTDYTQVFFNLGKIGDKEEEMRLINEYSLAERYRMQSIVNVTRAYMKHVIK